ncbi:MFS transporter [Micromonospora sp. NPDC005215]|uniref:MFS transporter n=1 Tax=Micromonospora sp. NPDC005215 TaxID=3157024 RepID=UPI0033AEE473
MTVNSLYHRSFIALVSGGFVSALGTVVFDLVLAWWVVSTTGSAVLTGYLLAAALAPIAFIGPIGGVLSDRWNKKAILIVTDVISGAVAFGVALMAYGNALNVPLLALSCFALGTCTALYRPAARSIVPLLVRERHLVKANSVSTNLTETTKAVGPLLGAALIAMPVIGVGGAMVLNGVSFWLSALAAAAIRYTHVTNGKDISTVMTDLRAGFRYINSRVLIRNMVILCAAVNFFLIAFNILLPLYVTEVLHGSSAIYGRALTAEAVGGIAVTLLLLFLHDIVPTNRLLAALIAAGGMALTLIPVVPAVAGLLLFAAAQGFFVGGFNTLFFAYIQKEVSQQFLGRVFSVVYMAAIGVMPIAYISWGYIGDYALRWGFVYAGLGTVLCSVPFLLLRRHVTPPVAAPIRFTEPAQTTEPVRAAEPARVAEPALAT